jgi:hypothetical protein
MTPYPPSRNAPRCGRALDAFPPFPFPLVINTPHPLRVRSNNLLATSKSIHSSNAVLLALPNPAAIATQQHKLPLKSGASSDLHVAASPHVRALVRQAAVVVRVCVQSHGAVQVPATELGNGANDVDAFAILSCDADGEGEGDGCGVRASWVSIRNWEVERGGSGAVAASVDVEAVVVGIDGAVVQRVRGGVGEVVWGRGGDDVGRYAVARREIRLICGISGILRWIRDAHSLCKVLLQGEVEVADLELLGDHPGNTGEFVSLVLSSTGKPLVYRCLHGVITPPAMKVS